MHVAAACLAGLAVVAAEIQRPDFAVFTLVRGGPLETDYDSFVNSRHCLREALPVAIEHDDIAFHDGNVQPEMQLRMEQKTCAPRP
eukprot:5313086-Prymnesium_polylepis.1